MPCCGGSTMKRTMVTEAQASRAPALFEYKGDGPFTTFGRVTGVRYHFAGPHARVNVDGRDVPFLDVVRGLARVTDTTSAGVTRSF